MLDIEFLVDRLHTPATFHHFEYLIPLSSPSIVSDEKSAITRIVVYLYIMLFLSCCFQDFLFLPLFLPRYFSATYLVPSPSGTPIISMQVIVTLISEVLLIFLQSFFLCLLQIG